MASALLASRNEPYWGDPKVYMRKNPNLNPKFFPNPNPNFDLQRADDYASGPRDQLRSMEFDEPSASAAAAAASDDSSSFNRKPAADLGQRSDFGDHVTFHIASYSKKELRELKRRLMSELDQVRSVSSRIESRELQPSFRSAGYSTSAAYAGGREVSSAAALPEIPGSDPQAPRSTPNANQVPYHPDVTKQRPLGAAAAPELKKLHTAMMKKCSQMLTKLMKHKGAIWFNTPVDVVGMGLHDYHQIIKSPMDLGSVKSKLSKGFYHSPLEFASDIRLTFKNALVYNPEGHDVHRLADQLLKQFESMFAPAITKHEKQRSAILSAEEDRRQSASSWARVGSTMKPDPCISLPPRVRTPVQSKAAAAAPSQPVQPQPLLQQQPLPQQDHQPMHRNPKANEPSIKRPMSLEEKHRLGSCIQNLPDEKMAEVLHIVSRRNETLQNGDEVEIDFEVMDNETLWELDGFVSDWNNSMSKTKKRQEIMANGHTSYQDTSSVVAPSSPSSAHPAPPPEVGNKPPVPAEETPEAVAAKKSKKGDPVDEEVDIGDDMPAIHYPSVEIEKESSSSSSGSGSSSSSSDSDSGSSSGSDSDDDDDDDARSLPAGSKPSPRS